jgi:hypothetical protein
MSASRLEQNLPVRNSFAVQSSNGGRHRARPLGGDSDGFGDEGERVTSVTTCSEALNNRGEIIMTDQSQNPVTFDVRPFIVKATPKDWEPAGTLNNKAPNPRHSEYTVRKGVAWISPVILM